MLSLGQSETEDGYLQAREIFGMRLNAEMAVLSACQIGLGKLFTGEGLVGLTRAFMYAGASTVVANLWNVKDQSTALLMEKFYQNIKAGQPKAEALRQAKLSLIQTKMSDDPAVAETYANPHYWAPFVVIGVWK